MKKKDKTLDIIQNKMEDMNLYDSYGLVILRNGAAIQIRHFFDYFLNTWQAYKIAGANGDTKVLTEIMTDTGGILHNDEVAVNVDDIMSMIAVQQIQDNDIDHDLPLDDYIHLIDGDSK
jgi:hypothetical protein